MQSSTPTPTIHKSPPLPKSITTRPIITLEEHFLSHVATTKPHSRNDMFKHIPDIYNGLVDLDVLRLTDMDAGNATMQVISHGPGSLSAAECRACNDQLGAAIRAHPRRFRGFAELCMDEPEEAARELCRTCGGDVDIDTNDGGFQGGDGKGEGKAFVGALIDSHTETGKYYDGPEYDVFWTAAEQVDVPIYIHPTWPSDALVTAYASPHLSDEVTGSILAFAFGWHSDVAVHVLKLYASGVFDRFPRLKIVIGHMGEMIPFMLQRIERVSARWERDRSFRQVWDENIWLTTSGNWALDPLACILRNTRPERIMYSVDYPFAKSVDGLKWLRELEESGMVSEKVLEGIRWKNAAALLKIDEDSLLA